MKLIDPYTGEMECKVCGSTHFANIKPRSGGRFYRGSWQCVYGCELPEKNVHADVEQRSPASG
jgi:hypothetical protein